MIRTSINNGKQAITKLALRRETIKTLDSSELATVISGAEPPCTNTNRFSGCFNFKLDGDTK